MKNHRLYLLLSVLLMMSGCNSASPRSGLVAAEAGASAAMPGSALPFDESSSIARELDEDSVYSFLLAEIAAKQGQLKLALAHYLHTATLLQDPYPAQRATRIALFLKDFEKALLAVNRWVEIAPDSMLAHQMQGLVRLKRGEQELAKQAFNAVLQIAWARNQDGMLLLASVLQHNAEPEQVLSLLRELSAEYPQDARSYYALAVVLVSQKHYAEAETVLRQAIQLDREWSQPHALLSQVLTGLGRAPEGLQHLQTIVQELPEKADLRFAYARLLVANSAYAEALEQFRSLYQQQSEDSDVIYAYAMLATQQKAWEEASPLWRQLQKASRFEAEATYFLAQVEEAQGNLEQAISDYLDVDEGPLRVDAVIRASSLLADTGDLAQAQEYLTQARVAHADRGQDLYLAETQVLQRTGQPPEQILAVYQVAIDQHPQSNDLLYNRGLYYSELQEFELMEADFQAVIARQPDHAESLNALGYVLADRGIRLQQALEYIQRAHQLRPDNPAILDSLGWVHYRLGDLERALKYLEAAVETQLDDEIAAHYGEVLWVSGRTEEARQVWSEAFKLAPESPFLRAVFERFSVSP